jgi:hypothetical protein
MISHSHPRISLETEFAGRHELGRSKQRPYTNKPLSVSERNRRGKSRFGLHRRCNLFRG